MEKKSKKPEPTSSVAPKGTAAVWTLVFYLIIAIGACKAIHDLWVIYVLGK